MDFCPDCGKLFHIENNKQGHTIYLCIQCGYMRELDENEDVNFTKNIRHNLLEHLMSDDVIILDTDSEELAKISVITERNRLIRKNKTNQIDSTRSTTVEYCPRCKKNRKVFFRIFQFRSADESFILDFECTECGETWTVYD